jgi:hypothetical protein
MPDKQPINLDHLMQGPDVAAMDVTGEVTKLLRLVKGEMARPELQKQTLGGGHA